METVTEYSGQDFVLPWERSPIYFSDSRLEAFWSESICNEKLHAGDQWQNCHGEEKAREKRFKQAQRKVAKSFFIIILSTVGEMFHIVGIALMNKLTNLLREFANYVNTQLNYSGDITGDLLGDIVGFQALLYCLHCLSNHCTEIDFGADFKMASCSCLLSASLKAK